jgi:hypothetical protein
MKQSVSSSHFSISKIGIKRCRRRISPAASATQNANADEFISVAFNIITCCHINITKKYKKIANGAYFTWNNKKYCNLNDYVI